MVSDVEDLLIKKKMNSQRFYYLTMEYYGGDKEKIIFYMDVQTGNILESDKNGKDEIYYLQSTLRDWYNDMREKLLEGYQNGKFTILPEWDEQG